MKEPIEVSPMGMGGNSGAWTVFGAVKDEDGTWEVHYWTSTAEDITDDAWTYQGRITTPQAGQPEEDQ